LPLSRRAALTVASLLARSLILATALGNLTPIVSSVLGWCLGRESMSAAKVLGISLAVGGSIFMVDPGTRPSGLAGNAPARAAFLRGCALLTVAPCAWASSLYVQKPLLARYPPFSLTAWTFAGGTAAMAALAAALYGKQPDAWRIGRSEAIALVAASLIGCFFKFCCVSWLNKSVDATLLCILETGGHVLTILLSVPVLGEKLYARYLGSIPVFAGCLLVALASHWGGAPEADPLPPVAKQRGAWWPRRRADELADARQALLGDGPEGPPEEEDDTAPAEAAHAEEAL
jgi:drug/metabolite transporter (DMT)-like permease